MSESVFPLKQAECGVNGITTIIEQKGLSKRELFAALAMQGQLDITTVCFDEQIAKRSVQLADALIKALEGGDE